MRDDTRSTSATWSFRQRDWEEKEQPMNESVTDEVVCRRALATPGLLNIPNFFMTILHFQKVLKRSNSDLPYHLFPKDYTPQYGQN